MTITIKITIVMMISMGTEERMWIGGSAPLPEPYYQV